MLHNVVQCTMHNVLQRTMHNVLQCTKHNVLQCTMHNVVQCTMHNVVQCGTGAGEMHIVWGGHSHGRCCSTMHSASSIGQFQNISFAKELDT